MGEGGGGVLRAFALGLVIMQLAIIKSEGIFNMQRQPVIIMHSLPRSQPGCLPCAYPVNTVGCSITS